MKGAGESRNDALQPYNGAVLPFQASKAHTLMLPTCRGNKKDPTPTFQTKEM